jgi:hypothetical protein
MTRSLSSVVCSAVVSAVALAMMSGCGIGDGPSVAPTAVTLPAMQGIVHGGANPIIGALVTLYETQTSATTCTSSCSTYGSAGLSLGTATTGANGGFTFATGYTCTSTEYAYMVVTEPASMNTTTGDTAQNANGVLMAALGSCSNLGSASSQAATTVFINELSTVAAAYALGNFISVSGSTGAQVVGVGAPYTNAATGSCTVAANVTSACTAAGLAHGFANAANLVSAVGFSSAVPTGAAYTAPPSNALGLVPQALLNSLGNVLQSCVNSTGGTTASTNCGMFFSAVKPFVLSGTASAPTDTLSAAIDVVKSPTSNVGTIYGLANPTGFFNPTLAQAPTDWSLAIVYSVPINTGTATVAGFPMAVALDPNDNVCLLVADTPPVTTNDLVKTYTTLDLLTANGTLTYDAVPQKGASTTATSYFLHPAQAATDTQGHCYGANFAASNAEKYVQQMTTSSGAVTLLPYSASVAPIFEPVGTYAIAFDRSNNLYVSATPTGKSEIYKSAPPYTTAPVAQTYGVLSATATTPAIGGIAIDNSQNIWSSGASIASATNSLFDIDIAGTSEVGPSSLDSYGAQTLAIDKNGNGWFPMVADTEEVSVAGAKVTSVGSGTGSTPANFSGTATGSQFDGSNVLWYGTDTAIAPLQFIAGTTTGSIQPCYPVTGSSGLICADQQTSGAYAPTQYTRSLQIDSTGSLWLAAGAGGTATAGGSADVGTSGVLIQVIGTASPTWPSLAWGNPGVTP